jgi:hypothetical protein
MVPHIAQSFYVTNQDVTATGAFQNYTPLRHRTRLARHLQAGDSIWFVFAVPEIIAAGGLVTVPGTINCAVSYQINSHFIILYVFLFCAAVLSSKLSLSEKQVSIFF